MTAPRSPDATATDASSVAADTPRFDPFDPALRIDPYPIYEDFRRRGPVHRGDAPMPSFPRCHYVFGHAEVLGALRDSRLGRERVGADGSRRPAIPDAATIARRLARRMIFFVDPPEHTRARRMLQAGFTADLHERVEAMAGVIAAETAERLAKERDTVDLVQYFSAELPTRVVAQMMGIPESDRLRVRRWSAQMASVVDVRRRAELAGPSRAAAELADYLRGRFRAGPELDRCPAGGMLESMREVAEEEGAGEHDLLANLVFLVSAAQETTVNFLGNALVALLRHPEARTEFAEGAVPLVGAVEELLRFDSPVQIVFRTAHEPTSVGPVELGTGDNVALLLGAANHDPAVFDEPDRLDLKRVMKREGARDGRAVAFGAGTHRCMGSAMARMEGRVALDALRPLLPRMELVGDVEWHDSLAFRGPSCIPVRVR